MKPLKVIIVLCVFACFSVGLTGPQVSKWSYTESYHYENSVWDCVYEPLTGDIIHTFNVTWREGEDWFKWQDRYKGTLIGDISGAIYTISQVANDHTISAINVNGRWTGNWSYITTFTIVREGQTVATYHRLIRATGNTSTWESKEGNWASYVDNEWFECN